ncbi:MAG: hypothetical protein J6X44_00060 [Thermoguttaceae bacterium]|nr:hypothetical protein [Thermoguttaceae bacterium]
MTQQNQKLKPSLFSERYDDFAARFLCTFNGNVKCFFPLRKVMEEYYRSDNRVSCARLRDRVLSYGCKAYVFDKEVYVDMRSINSVYYTPKGGATKEDGKRRKGAHARGTKILHIIIDVALMKAEKFGVGNSYDVKESYDTVKTVAQVKSRNLFGEEETPRQRKESIAKDLPVKKAVSLNVFARPSAYSFVESDKSFSTDKQGV